MAGKLKFPLKMADGATVKDLEELKKHFDLAAVLGYYYTGKLAEWLEIYYYEDEAQRVRALDSSEPDLKRKLCEILGIQSADIEEMVDKASSAKVKWKNRRLEELQKHTDDDKILAAVDHVAFTQEDLVKLLEKEPDIKEIYLCGERFAIPEDWKGITYIGVNHPQVYMRKGLNGVTVEQVKVSSDWQEFKPEQLWCSLAEQGNTIAQNELGNCFSVMDNARAAFKWFLRAAQQGNADAQYHLGCCYLEGRGVPANINEAAIWLQKACDQNIDGARPKLLKLIPEQFKLSEVVLCATGGKENIDSAQLDTSTYTIGIAVKDREKVDEAVLERYGATEIRTAPIYYGRTEKKIDPQKALGVAARAYFGLWGYDLYKAVFKGKPWLDIWTNKAIRGDFGWGFLRFRLKMISIEMAEDFDRNVKKDPDTP